MSEVKGALLTLILTLLVFGVVYGIVSTTVTEKAEEIQTQIADIPVSEEAKS